LRFQYGAAFPEDPIVDRLEARTDTTATGDDLFRPVEVLPPPGEISVGRVMVGDI
jgi:hypothetical protein